MLVVTAEFGIDPTQLDQFLPLMADNARTSTALEPGFYQFDITQNPRNSASILLYELHDDAAAFDAHKVIPRYPAFIADTDSIIHQQNSPAMAAHISLNAVYRHQR